MGYAIKQFVQEEHRLALLGLWKAILENATEERMNALYGDNSCGEPASWLVMHDVALSPVGSVSYFPRQLSIDDKEYRMGVNFDMMMLKEHRTLGPILMALRSLVNGCRELDCRYLLAMPNERSQPVFKRVGYKKIGTAYRWSKVLRSKDKLSAYIGNRFIRSIASYCVDVLLRYISLEPWVRLRHLGLLTLKCQGKINGIDSLSSLESNQPLSDLKKNAFIKWRYLNSLCKTKTNVYTLSSEGKTFGKIIYSLDGYEVVVHDVLSYELGNEEAALLFSKFIREIRSCGYKSISLAFYGPAKFEALLRRFGFMRREGRDLFLFDLLGENGDALNSSIAKIPWFEGDLDL